KAKMSELLVKAREGEDVVITVRGRPAARLVPVDSEAKVPDLRKWAEEIRCRLSDMKAAPASSSREIIEDLRGER
ncbi:MAG: type II toxin-antitoxin system Phd/YefM family antitoxin, partial [Puniceicoccaceae bacterium]